jgi:hypothetical protein
VLVVSSGAGQQVFASRDGDAVAAQVFHGVVGLAMADDVRLQWDDSFHF